MRPKPLTLSGDSRDVHMLVHLPDEYFDAVLDVVATFNDVLVGRITLYPYRHSQRPRIVNDWPFHPLFHISLPSQWVWKNKTASAPQDPDACWDGSTGTGNYRHIYLNPSIHWLPGKKRSILTVIKDWWTHRDKSATLDIRYVLAHEMGHCLGLDHSNNPKDVMFTYNDGRKWRGLSQNDINNLKQLYGINS